MTRFFDILFSTLAIIVLFPILIPVMIALKLTGEHYIFYEQERAGRGGKTFKLLKFATMLKDSPNMPGGMFTSENDPRMLPFGKILRKTKINELPQLFNILKGDMSIIGYRPISKDQYERYPEDVKAAISKLRPGLSGIGSIVFRDEEHMLHGVDDKEKFYNELIAPYKGAVEKWYAEHRSIGMYFLLIDLTVDAVLRPKSRRWWHLLKDKGLPCPPKELQEYL